MLDAEAKALTQAGQPIPLGQRAIAVLLVLVRAGGEYVPKTRIVEAAWPGRFVEESNLSVQISAIRRALSIVPGGNAWLETLQGRGYRFVGPVASLPEGTACQAAAATRTNVTEPMTSFIGRAREQKVIRDLLANHRLVTLTGAGGVGKTRLALRVATGLLEVYRDGVWLAEMASLRDPDLVPRTVAAALGIEERSGESSKKVLAQHLESRQLLLVLDNAEHLVAACAQLADEVTRQCPHVAVVVTSRERLAVPGEVIHRVASLSIPDPQPHTTNESVLPYESVQLFRDRAQLLVPNFSITDHNAPAVASICRRLDGIPLAIELAAARMRSMSAEEVDRRLDQRFRLLAAGSRTVPRRHQTLRAAIDWSYDLLSDAEKALLERLSVFSRGWTLEAAENVCRGEGIEQWEVLDLVTALVDKNLVATNEDRAETRYALLETVRQYAWDRLTEKSDCHRWQRAHLAYFLQLADQAEGQLRGAEQQRWLDMLEAEHDNVRSALRWSSANNDAIAEGLRLAALFWPFWLMRGHFREGRDWLARFLAVAPAEGSWPMRARALRGSGVMAELEGDYAAARASYDQSIAIWRQLGDRRGIAASLNNLGSVACAQGDDETAQGLWEQTLAIRRETADELGVADVLGNLGKVAYHRGDYDAARAMWNESLSISRRLDDRRGMSFSLSNLGRVALDQGDHASARAVWEESGRIAEELGDRWGYAWSLMDLGDLASAQNDYPKAKALHQQSLAIRRELGNRPSIVDSLERLAAIAVAMESPSVAARLWGAVERLRTETGTPLSRDEQIRHEGLVARAHDALGDDSAFTALWQRGRDMTLAQAVAYALGTGSDG
jgi:non-specific serine/threonine protein kinase